MQKKYIVRLTDEEAKRSGDTRFPVPCMNEQPVQLVKENREPIAAVRKYARRVDHRYELAAKDARHSLEPGGPSIVASPR